MAHEFNWIYTHERNKESESVKYIEKLEEYKFAVPLISSMKRQKD